MPDLPTPGGGLTRYRWLASTYDVFSGEVVYRVGRRLGVDLLGLQPGDVVLDLGCGTGLNLPLLQRAVGPTGRIVGVDASPAMLAQAEARARRSGWANVELIQADAQTLDPALVRERVGGGCDAAIATYALSLMPRWREAWERLLGCCRPRARVAVVDMQVPSTAAPLRAAARLACRLGGSDVTAHPWQALEETCIDLASAEAWRGHVQVRVGRLSG